MLFTMEVPPWQTLFPELLAPPDPSFSSALLPPPPSVLIDNATPALARNSSPIKKSFAQAVSNSFDIPFSQPPKSCLKGNEFAIKISESEYQAGVHECRNILYGRLILSKGDSPLKLNDLRVKLLKIWKLTSSWTVVSLGKGFYEFNFASLDDQRKIISHGSWTLNPGVLRLTSWTPDFNPNLIRQSNVQCWVRFHGLSREYWRPKILLRLVVE